MACWIMVHIIILRVIRRKGLAAAFVRSKSGSNLLFLSIGNSLAKVSNRIINQAVLSRNGKR